MNRSPGSITGQNSNPAAGEMRERSLSCLGSCGFHRMAYTEWGDPQNPEVLVCVHGLTRNGRDFDDLARAMVIATGSFALTSWAAVAADGCVTRRLTDFPPIWPTWRALIARLDVEKVHWVGTSMGA